MKQDLVSLLGLLVVMAIVSSAKPRLPRYAKREKSFEGNDIVTRCQLYPFWKIRVNRDYVGENGTVIPCSATVHVTICVGGCDTSEVSPFEISKSLLISERCDNKYVP